MAILKWLRRARLVLVLAIFVIGPFHAFLITWIRSAASRGGFFLEAFTVWREIFAALIFAIVIAEIFLEKRRLHLDVLDWLIIAYCAGALAWLPVQWNEKSQWLLGVRFDIMPVVFYLISRHAKWDKKHLIITASIFAGIIVMIFGLMQAVALPQDFLTRFGYSMNQDQFSPDIAVSGCQYLEHTSAVCRAVSTFGGPTRYGVYLMVIAGLIFPFIINHAGGLRVFGALALMQALASAALTYSRSIWIGFIFMIALGFFWIIRNFLRHSSVAVKSAVKITAAGVCALAILGGAIFYSVKPQFFNTIFVRASSSGEHWQLMRKGLEIAMQSPFGVGLGKVGPASVRFSKQLTENWYLQIADEMGWIALILFAAILALISKKLLHAKDNWTRKGLFLALLGISIAGLFTHSFEETAAVMILFGTIGIVMNKY